MVTKTSDLASVLERVEKLERQNRKLKSTGLIALIAIGGLLLMGQASSKSRTIRAEEFQLVDSHDKVMGRIRVDGNSPQIVLFNENGAETVSLYAYHNTGELLLSDLDSGVTTRTSAGSIVMTERAKKIWSVP